MVQAAALSPSIYQLCLVHTNAPKRFTRPLQPLVDTLSRGVNSDLRTPSPASYIFITTLDSPRLRNVFSEGSLNAGFVVVDEAHQVLRRKDSLTFRMVSEFSGNGADVWFVTATPFSGCTLAQWVAPMNLIAPSRAAAMQELVTALDTAKSSGDADDAQTLQDQFKVVFDERLVVRHFGTSSFFAKSISDVQAIVPSVISRETPMQHKTAVQELSNQVALKDPRLTDPGQRGLLYLVSLFPAAAELILADPITFDVAAIRDFVRQVKNRLHIEESEPLRRLADHIVKDSPKLDYILEELDRMGLDKRERERIEHRSSAKFGAGEDLKMKKMVIITPTVVSAVFLYLALIRHRKDVVLIHNWVSSQEKEQIVNNFMSLSAAKLVKHSRILIAPFAMAGTGVNLQVASYQILTSPLPDKASQLQAFARTNRSGQRLRPLSHKILVLEDSPVDRIVLASHATLDIESDPFQINEPLRIAGNIPLGNVVQPTSVVEDHSSSTHSSILGVDEALLLQDALRFPVESNVNDGTKTEEAERENRSVSTTPPASRYQVSVNRDNFEIWVSDSASSSSETGPNNSLEPLTLGLPADFSPSIGNITAVLDTWRRQHERPHSASAGGDDSSNPGFLASPVRRVPGPIAGQRPREYGDDIPESDRGLMNRPFSVLDSRAARLTALAVEGDRFEESQQDAQTLAQRGQAVRDRGEAPRQPGQEFHDGAEMVTMHDMFPAV
ncbi:hypothetical protein INS49_009250 [Diaporthe citri]|uniref:uncharacterized protein n=1 Tax=Diaporthe citri TaxID=83186 RepID=UPI001C807D19|nr:uncharacterized protein INS49_009250 [Diaporthe citri]KAG6361031.1 hypothetical protein INS49_009250 [Diaporthe citri]